MLDNSFPGALVPRRRIAARNGTYRPERCCGFCMRRSFSRPGRNTKQSARVRANLSRSACTIRVCEHIRGHLSPFLYTRKRGVMPPLFPSLYPLPSYCHLIAVNCRLTAKKKKWEKKEI
ncbi:hypothetical protein PUN28_013136 [Cardiocondyla obscurior]|uniref:Ribosomal protein L34 n=1 Tax=Cardiocondyla obscurior TaxID=286306 RepID=A0AAW2F767_9HYME